MLMDSLKRVFSGYAAVFGLAERAILKNGLNFWTAAAAVRPFFFRKIGIVPCSTN
jgi:hypothetical protein